MLSLIIDILGILGFVLSLILAVIEIRSFYLDRPKIKIELTSSSRRLRTIKQQEKSIEIFTSKGPKYTLPSKMLYFIIEFYIVNEGSASVGIKDVYLQWKTPHIGSVETDLRDVGEQADFTVSEKRKGFILNGGEQKNIRLIQEPAYKLQALLFTQNMFKHEIRNIRHVNHEYIEKLPPGIVLNVVVVDQRDKRHIREVPFI